MKTFFFKEKYKFSDQRWVKEYNYLLQGGIKTLKKLYIRIKARQNILELHKYMSLSSYIYINSFEY